MPKLLRYTAIILATVIVSACSSKPNETGLRDSFAQQMSANKFIKDFKRSGDDLTFTGPGAEGGTAKWKIHIDAATIEDSDNPAQPYKGTVKSSWYSNDQRITPRGSESHLPIELIANGLAQDCYAYWDKASKKWSWE